MSTSAKGRNIENNARKILEHWGYEVERTYRKTVWSKGRIISLPNDFFGCIDLIAINRNGIRFIQVTVPNHYREKIDEILKHKWPMFSQVEIWVWYGGRRDKMNKAQLFDVWCLDFESNEFKKAFIVDMDNKIFKDYIAYEKNIRRWKDGQNE